MAVILGAVLAGVAALPALAQEGEDTTVFSCEDGTELQALFSDTDVRITLADGKSVTLPMVENEAGWAYATPKFKLAGSEDGITWTAGKKAPVNCQGPEEGEPSPFDEPSAVDTEKLPADPANPDIARQVNCYRFQDFTVKEVDLGEKGADKLAIAASDAKCQKDDTADRVIAGDAVGYFFGAKGDYLFFQASDGWNGGLPFVVYDAKTLKPLFDDSLEGDFTEIKADAGKLTLKFRRAYTAECSLYLDGGNCPDLVRKALGIGDALIPLPECGPAYDAEKKRTPDYAKEIEELPSVISYEAELVFDGKAAKVKPLEGEVTCRVPD